MPMKNDTYPHQSSAQALSSRLTQQGVAPADINATHLIDIYPTLKTLPGRANFTLAEPLLANLPEGGFWGERDLALIVETRDIPQLAYVIKNVAIHTDLPIQLFHSQQNRSILETPYVKQLQHVGKLTATCITNVNLNASIYNAMFLDMRFYKALAGRGRFLVFQTDSLCCENSNLTLEYFNTFDYIGALWNTKRPIGLDIHGGIGGFSLRDYNACCDMLTRFPSTLWSGGEDGYFAFHLDLTGHKVADPFMMAKFCTQIAFRYKSFGAHKVRDLLPEDHIKFLEYCPEVRNILAWSH